MRPQFLVKSSNVLAARQACILICRYNGPLRLVNNIKHGTVSWAAAGDGPTLRAGYMKPDTAAASSEAREFINYNWYPLMMKI